MANAAKRRNIIGIPSIIPIVFPLITGKLNIERYSYTQYIRECMRYSFYFPTFGHKANMSKRYNFDTIAFPKTICNAFVYIFRQKDTSVIRGFKKLWKIYKAVVDVSNF